MLSGALLGAPCGASSCVADTEWSRARHPGPWGGGPSHVQGGLAYSQQRGSSLLLLLVVRFPRTAGAAGSQGPLISHMTPGAGPEPCREGSWESHQSAPAEPNCPALPSPATAGARPAAWPCTPVPALVPAPVPALREAARTGQGNCMGQAWGVRKALETLGQASATAGTPGGP